MQYKNTTEIKERILIAIAPSCLNIFLFSRWLSICSFSLLGLAFQCESLGAWHINPEHTGWCPSHAVSAKCLLQEWWIFMPLWVMWMTEQWETIVRIMVLMNPGAGTHLPKCCEQMLLGASTGDQWSVPLPYLGPLMKTGVGFPWGSRRDEALECLWGMALRTRSLEEHVLPKWQNPNMWVLSAVSGWGNMPCTLPPSCVRQLCGAYGQWLRWAQPAMAEHWSCWGWANFQLPEWPWSSSDMWGSRATSLCFESAVRHGKVTVWAVWLSPAAPGITRQTGWVCTQPVPGLAVKACSAGRALPTLLSPSRAEEQQSVPHGHCPLHLLQGPCGCLHFLHLGCPGCQGTAAECPSLLSPPRYPQPPKVSWSITGCAGVHPIPSTADGQCSTTAQLRCPHGFCISAAVWTLGLPCSVLPYGLWIRSFGCARAVYFVTQECQRMLGSLLVPNHTLKYLMQHFTSSTTNNAFLPQVFIISSPQQSQSPIHVLWCSHYSPALPVLHFQLLVCLPDLCDLSVIVPPTPPCTVWALPFAAPWLSSVSLWFPIPLPWCLLEPVGLSFRQD